MVARAKAVQKKLRKRLQQAEQPQAEAGHEGPAPPLKVQRKVARKVQFLERVAASKPKLAVKQGGAAKKKRKAKPLENLSTLMGTLGDASHARAQERAEKEERQARHMLGQRVKRQHVRALVLEQEAPRLQQVLHHPSFQADPLAAVKNHFAATLPPPPAAQPGKAGGKGKGQATESRYERKKRQRANRAAAAAMAE